MKTIRKTNLILGLFICILTIASGFRWIENNIYGKSTRIEQKAQSLRDSIFKYCPSDTTPKFMDVGPKEGLKEALEYYGILHPEIVYAQAVLETGNFKSALCKRGNLFGLKKRKKDKNKKGSYQTFDHWAESVEAYKSQIQSRYRVGREDYYTFLRRIRYASNPQYTTHLKSIVKNTKS